MASVTEQLQIPVTVVWRFKKVFEGQGNRACVLLRSALVGTRNLSVEAQQWLLTLHRARRVTSKAKAWPQTLWRAYIAHVALGTSLQRV
jgi:hypothetical protein